MPFSSYDQSANKLNFSVVEDEIMREIVTNRRLFLQASGAGALGIILKTSKAASAGAFEVLRIEEPFHGAVLNRRHGEAVKDGLKILQVIHKILWVNSLQESSTHLMQIW